MNPFIFYVIARSALVLGDGAISYTVGDCFGRKNTALAMTKLIKQNQLPAKKEALHVILT